MKHNTRYSPKITETPNIQSDLDTLRSRSNSATSNASCISDHSDHSDHSGTTVVYKSPVLHNYSYDCDKDTLCPTCQKKGPRECVIRWTECGHVIKNELIGKPFILE